MGGNPRPKPTPAPAGQRRRQGRDGKRKAYGPQQAARSAARRRAARLNLLYSRWTSRIDSEAKEILRSRETNPPGLGRGKAPHPTNPVPAPPEPTGPRGHSSAGRAPDLHSGGRRFDPVWLHHFPGSRRRTKIKSARHSPQPHRRIAQLVRAHP